MNEVLRVAPGGLVLIALCCNSFTAMQLGVLQHSSCINLGWLYVKEFGRCEVKPSCVYIYIYAYAKLYLYIYIDIYYPRCA